MAVMGFIPCLMFVSGVISRNTGSCSRKKAFLLLRLPDDLFVLGFTEFCPSSRAAAVVGLRQLSCNCPCFAERACVQCRFRKTENEASSLSDGLCLVFAEFCPSSRAGAMVALRLPSRIRSSRESPTSRTSTTCRDSQVRFSPVTQHQVGISS